MMQSLSSHSNNTSRHSGGVVNAVDSKSTSFGSVCSNQACVGSFFAFSSPELEVFCLIASLCLVFEFWAIFFFWSRVFFWRRHVGRVMTNLNGHPKQEVFLRQPTLFNI